MDTIYALASARGKAGVAVLRLSGPQAHEAVAAFGVSLPEVRRAALRRLTWNGEVLDEALILLFAEGASFTGERSAEIHLHGSAAAVSSVLQALSELPGLRLADAGEFTRRALDNGRLDLAQVEGLADLLDSETEAQRRQAMRVFSGAIGKRTERWRSDLIRAAALLEATIDFADEDVPVDVTPEVRGLLERLISDLKREVDGSRVAERIRDGFEVAIIGAPNAGKSTLLNALAQREAAITSEVAGTTRDVIEVRMNLGGLAVTLLDTAGLRETHDPVEALGIDRALTRARAADLRIFLLDRSGEVVGLEPEADDLIVQGKADTRLTRGLSVSGLTGDGIQELVEALQDRLLARTAGAGSFTRERHRLAMERAIRAMESAHVQLMQGVPHPELAAEDLRLALRALDSLVGRVDVEALLGEIFSSFCIGK
ncbi:tRNA uridine-5-carboxymethylaminomethyl(34) synthesis GTPase MnmE [Cereibacter azotoformans]|uniref:tRNA modification GTPase MnmE n=1 Tax=Cereibacter azotoformans TaxID=43057 RepID=A0A2T5K897_9RHOB|nr:tRNA uridine-5-carboxymethylaminomethyl(34) synthesis GTPase MnmE [Cereibacter azotoformans]AXQ94945.1 tRNA uridine-5-carboxymethylaminomethyl(34) synthesis GTPase MnmE [Cereibacter sphaeroides]MBO4170179.1 tRNA uridine-5-carboxymethylaminomethyl(34) synthesis GTPase MnmE [Cereibacter azotoformans]PTR18636.1 tRNA modification GTPase trmE [Cereibacter azotoformans]UIJ30527.1 tRNA uridine-5-carboxymethylaminomethyl(34) synthesis GTPase MnmE [Cereibacter azotoformans]